MNNLHYISLTQVAELIKTKQVSPVTVVEECVRRIEQFNPATNAFITVMADEARAQAKQAEAEINAGNYRGPLHGVPVAFKDMYDTADIKTTAAFKYFRKRVPSKDAVAVAKLKDAGAIVIGKTNMHELAMGTTSLKSDYGPVKNPWNPDRIAGGSSGGSAVAVALGMCYATVDTDAVGSCRLPASCCGVVGYKCTWGLIDNNGILAGERTDEVILKLAAVGVMTRDVSDTSIIVDTLTDGGETYSLAAKSNHTLHLGVVANFEASQEVRYHFDKAVTELAKLGFKTTEANAPFTQNPNMSAMDQARKSVDTDIFANADALVLPTTTTEPLLASDAKKDPQALSPQNTFFANYYGLPAVTVPCGFSENGLPVGLQIVGKPGDDATILQIAQQYQKTTPWPEKHPDESALSVSTTRWGGLMNSLFKR